MAAYVRDDTMVVPLTGINAAHAVFLPANTRPGVVYQTPHNYADAPFIVARPHLQKEGVVSKQITPSVAHEIPMSAFFRGGNFDGQY